MRTRERARKTPAVHEAVASKATETGNLQHGARTLPRWGLLFDSGRRASVARFDRKLSPSDVPGSGRYCADLAGIR